MKNIIENTKSSPDGAAESTALPTEENASVPKPQ